MAYAPDSKQWLSHHHVPCHELVVWQVERLARHDALNRVFRPIEEAMVGAAPETSGAHDSMLS